MKKEAHAFLTNANPAKFGKTVNASQKSVRMGLIRLMVNVLISVRVKRVKLSRLRLPLPLAIPLFVISRVWLHIL